MYVCMYVCENLRLYHAKMKITLKSLLSDEFTQITRKYWGLNLFKKLAISLKKTNKTNKKHMLGPVSEDRWKYTEKILLNIH